MFGRRPLRCPATALLAMIATLASGGCQLYPSPKVEVDPTGRLVQRSQEAVRFDIRLKLENPNDETLELREFQYSITVDGKRVYEGRRDPGANLAAGATKELELPAVVRYEVLGWTDVPASTEWQLKGHLVYLEPERLAEVLLDTGIYRPKVRFDALGDVDLLSGVSLSRSTDPPGRFLSRTDRRIRSGDPERAP